MDRSFLAARSEVRHWLLSGLVMSVGERPLCAVPQGVATRRQRLTGKPQRHRDTESKEKRTRRFQNRRRGFETRPDHGGETASVKNLCVSVPLWSIERPEAGSDGFGLPTSDAGGGRAARRKLSPIRKQGAALTILTYPLNRIGGEDVKCPMQVYS